MKAAMKPILCTKDNVIGQTFVRRTCRDESLVRASSHPQARYFGDLISSKQIQMAGSLSRSAGIDENDFAQKIFDCEIGELSKLAAEILIEKLEETVLGSESLNELRLTG